MGSALVIPGIVDKQFPKAYPQSTISWLHNEAEIPFALRGDASEFPDLDLSALHDAKSAASEFKEFEDSLRGIPQTRRVAIGICCNNSSQENFALHHVLLGYPNQY
jgi:hypothetical protein